jgi:hypothetical protein
MLLLLAEAAEGDAKQELTEGQLRLGLVECLNHGLLHPYPVLHEKTGELVAQVGGHQHTYICCGAHTHTHVVTHTHTHTHTRRDTHTCCGTHIR